MLLYSKLTSFSSNLEYVVISNMKNVGINFAACIEAYYYCPVLTQKDLMAVHWKSLSMVVNDFQCTAISSMKLVSSCIPISGL